MNDTPQSTFADRTIWVRLLYMLFCAIAWSVAELLVFIVALFQFLCVLVNGSVHERALHFGRNLSEYMTGLLQFVTFNDERVPFPFSDWPDATPGDTPWRNAAGARPPAGETRASDAGPSDADTPAAENDTGAPGDESPAPRASAPPEDGPEPEQPDDPASRGPG